MSLKNLRRKIVQISDSFSCQNVRGLEWEGNSCYMDSILFALFSTPNDFLERHTIRQRYLKIFENICGDDSEMFFHDLQRQLMLTIQDLRASLKTKNVCRSFRMFFKNNKECSIVKRYPAFYETGQQEALEFLQFLLANFGLNGERNIGAELIVTKRFGVFTRSRANIIWKEWFTNRDPLFSLIYTVPHDRFKTHRSLSSYLTYQTDSYDLVGAKYKGCLVNCSEEKVSLTRFSDMLILWVQRENPITTVVHHDKIRIPQTLTDSVQKTLHLDAVVLHLGTKTSSGHYVCYKRCQDEWIFFDDLRKKLESFSSWSKAVKSDPRILTHGVIFFYSVK